MSKSHKLEYYQIAAFQIDKAAELYETGSLEDLICAVTLAGAGEELLGKIVTYQLNEQTALDENVTAVLLKNEIDKDHKNFQKLKKEFIDTLNEPRNAFKHFIEGFCQKDIDPHFYAEMYINRAIINYSKLRGSITTKMGRFLDVAAK